MDASKKTFSDSFSSSIDQLGHRVLGALNMSDSKGIQDSIASIRDEVFSEVQAHPFKALASVVGVGFLIAHAATSGRSQIVKMIARGAGAMATGWLMEKLANGHQKTGQPSKAIRH